jgi:DNA-binding MarR family transcriptional regulator
VGKQPSRARSRTTSAKQEPESDAVFTNHLAHTILRTARLLRQLSQHDSISSSESAALMIVNRYGPMAVSELAAMENISRPFASAIVAKLTTAGYVSRAEGSDDRRVSTIKLTRRGRAVTNAVRSRRNTWLADQLAKRSPEELEALLTAAQILDSITIGSDRPWDALSRDTTSLTPKPD